MRVWILAVLMVGLWGIVIPAKAQNLPGFSVIQTNPYEIKGVKVEARAESGVAARQKAFEQALRQGFSDMLTLLVTDEARRAAIAVPDTATLGEMLKDFSTRDEKLGATLYAATFDLRFHSGRVARYVNMGGAGPQAAPAPSQPAPTEDPTLVSAPRPTPIRPALLLPFFQGPSGLTLWSAGNPLRDQWTSAAVPDPLLRVPIADLTDMQTLNEQAGLKYNPAQFVNLLHRYSVDQALILVAVPDTHAVRGGQGTVTTSPQKITVMMYHASTRAPNPVFLESVVIADQPPQSIYTRVADHVRAQGPSLLARIPQPDPMNTPTPAQAVVNAMATPPTDLPLFGQETQQSTTLRVLFPTMRDWQVVRARLNSIAGVQGITIARLRTGEAIIDVAHRLPTLDFADALQKAGFDVSPTVGDSTLGQPAPTYTLSLPQENFVTPNTTP